MFLVVHKECTESEYIFLCVLCCLMFIDMFHIQMQLMQRQDWWNESVCMYVCMSKVVYFLVYLVILYELCGLYSVK